MKKTVIFLMSIVLVFAFSWPLMAASLNWDPSEGTVEGYVVYYWPDGTFATNDQAFDRDSAAVGVYNVPGDTTKVEDIETLFSIPTGASVWFSVSAWNSAGESEPCAPIKWSPGYQPRADRAITFEASPGSGSPTNLSTV